MTLEGYRYEHRVVMEGILGRPLATEEVVHHVNGDPLDNRPENLCLTTKNGHNVIHGRQLPDDRWARDFDACTECGQTAARHAARGLCRSCYKRQAH